MERTCLFRSPSKPRGWQYRDGVGGKPTSRSALIDWQQLTATEFTFERAGAGQDEAGARSCSSVKRGPDSPEPYLPLGCNVSSLYLGPVGNSRSSH